MYKCASEYVESCCTSEQGTCWKVLHLLVRAISAFPAGESEGWTVKFTSSLFQDDDEDDINDDDDNGHDNDDDDDGRSTG